MNKGVLKLVHDNLMGWLAKSHMETISQDKKLDIIMMALADICIALGTDGTPESREDFDLH